MKKFQSTLSKLIPLFVLGALVSSNLSAAVTEVTATVDKNPVVVDEGFQLIIEANDDVSADALDTSRLLNDFVVGRTSVSRQTQIINFDTSRSTKWTTVLIPRQPGQFTIPSFIIEGQASSPIQLSVLPASRSAAAQGQDLFITVDTDLDEVYLQQQIRYTVKLHLAQNLQRGSLSTPEMRDADIQQVGNDKEYSEIVGGRRYRIIERTFSIIPQKSGEYAIQGPYFEGEVVDNNRQSFAFFNRTKPVNKVAKNLSVRVLPIPAGYNEHWLPSTQVFLNEEWQPDNNQLVVGEPVTRTITLSAMGLVEEQLPEINGAYPSAVKTYPDQAETSMAQNDSTFVAQRTETTAIIPNQEGQITIPEVRVPWFNVNTRQTEYAVLPARTFTVTPASISDSSSLPPQLQPTPQATVSLPEQSSYTVNQIPVVVQSWWSISSWVLLALWLLTAITWFVTSKNKKPIETNKIDNTNEPILFNELKKAAKNGDQQKFVNTLQRWLGELCQNPQQSLAKSLEQLHNQQLNEQLKNVFDARYGQKTAEKLDAQSLVQTLSEIRNNYKKSPIDTDTKLQPLYR